VKGCHAKEINAGKYYPLKVKLLLLVLTIFL